LVLESSSFGRKYKAELLEQVRSQIFRLSEKFGLPQSLEDSKIKTFKILFFETWIRCGGFEAGIMVSFSDNLKHAG